MNTELVAGRSCGPCTVCCVALTIDDPDLKKPQGYRCRNLRPEGGCRIYEKRPQTCRHFECGWRRLKWIREPMRPDKSGVLFRVSSEPAAADGTERVGVAFTLLNASSLKAEGLAESVAAAVAAGIPLYLDVPGPPGHTAAQARIDGALREAVGSREKRTVLDILRRLRAQGRGGGNVPIVFDPTTEPGGA